MVASHKCYLKSRFIGQGMNAISSSLYSVRKAAFFVDKLKHPLVIFPDGRERLIP